jgi:hypothetical protein
MTFLLVVLVNEVLQSLQRYFSTRNITSSKTIRELIWHNRPAVLAIALIAYLVRNRFNRGLNKYPGPFLASLTNWWRFWDVYKRRAEITQMKLHAQCGDVVRLGPNALSFSNPKALKTIYGLNKGFTKVRRSQPHSSCRQVNNNISLNSTQCKLPWSRVTNCILSLVQPPNCFTPKYGDLSTEPSTCPP